MKAFSSNPIVILSIVAIVFISGGLLYIYNPTPIEYGETNPKIACTMEAKLCPDGSSVGRVGPNCEFEKCPESKDTIETESGEAVSP